MEPPGHGAPVVATLHVVPQQGSEVGRGFESRHGGFRDVGDDPATPSHPGEEVPEPVVGQVPREEDAVRDAGLRGALEVRPQLAAAVELVLTVKSDGSVATAVRGRRGPGPPGACA